jgi:hypothetical protein
VAPALPLMILALAVGSTPAAGEFEVSVFVEPRSGLTDTRPFQFVIQIKGESAPQRVFPPDLSGVEGLAVVSGPNTHNRVFWSNGRSTSSYQVSFQMLAERPGTFTIPALELKIDGESYRTEPMQIEVRRGRDVSRGVTPGGTVAPSGEATDPVFLEIQLGEDEVWVGQPVPLTVTLFTALRVTNVSWRSVPAYKNFWVEKIDINPESEAFRKRIGDQVYTGYPLERRMLVPLRAGEFTIEPYVVQLGVRQSAEDVFDLFSFGRTQTIILKTPELDVRVKQLPGGQPEGFSGAVGQFRLSVAIDRDRAAVNDAVALRATVEGEGSLQSADPPIFDPPAGVKVFDAKITESTQRITGRMSSRRTWEWILVPLDPGQVELPEIRFPFFDPVTERYRVAETDPILLAVDRGDGLVDPTAIRSEIQMQRRDLAYIKPLRGQLGQSHRRVQQRGAFHALLVVPLIVTPLVILLGRRQARLRRDLGLSRSRRAKTKARKGLQAARRAVEHLDSSAFHEQVARTLVEYVADRFNRSPAGMTYESADDLLASRHVDGELRRRYRTCLEQCDFARFVPAASQAERRAEVLEEAGQIVDQLERAW